eukprot:gene10126-8026_t
MSRARAIISERLQRIRLLWLAVANKDYVSVANSSTAAVYVGPSFMKDCKKVISDVEEVTLQMGSPAKATKTMPGLQINIRWEELKRATAALSGAMAALKELCTVLPISGLANRPVEIFLSFVSLGAENLKAKSYAASIAAVIDVLSTFQLSQLHIKDVNLMGPSSEALCNILEQPSTTPLTRLVLTVALCNILEQPPTTPLTRLVLTVALCNILEQPSTTPLTRLVLTDVGLSQALMKRLSAAVATNKSLLTLDLSTNKMGPSAPAQIRSMLQKNKTLRELVLAFTGLESAGAAEILLGCQANLSLLLLDLSQNNLQDDVMLPIGVLQTAESANDENYIRNNSQASLRRLDLSFNTINNNIAGWIILAFEYFPRMTHLCLNHNQPKRDVVRYSARGSQLPSIRSTCPSLRQDAGHDRGLCILAHLQNYDPTSRLQAWLEGLNVLDMRGIPFPSWYQNVQPPGALIETGLTFLGDQTCMELNHRWRLALSNPSLTVDCSEQGWCQLPLSQQILAFYCIFRAHKHIYITTLPPMRRSITPSDGLLAGGERLAKNEGGMPFNLNHGSKKGRSKTCTQRSSSPNNKSSRCSSYHGDREGRSSQPAPISSRSKLSKGSLAQGDIQFLQLLYPSSLGGKSNLGTRSTRSDLDSDTSKLDFPGDADKTRRHQRDPSVLLPNQTNSTDTKPGAAHQLHTSSDLSSNQNSSNQSEEGASGDNSSRNDGEGVFGGFSNLGPSQLSSPFLEKPTISEPPNPSHSLLGEITQSSEHEYSLARKLPSGPELQEQPHHRQLREMSLSGIIVANLSNDLVVESVTLANSPPADSTTLPKSLHGDSQPSSMRLSEEEIHEGCDPRPGLATKAPSLPLLPSSHPTKGSQARDLSGEGSQPWDLRAEGSQPRDLHDTGSQPQDLRAGGSQPEDLSVESSQPEVQSGKGSQTRDLSGEGSQPWDLRAEGSQPRDLHDKGSQPGDLRAGGSQPEDLSAESSQPEVQSGKGSQTRDLSGEGSQPWDLRAEGSQPRNLRVKGSQPRDMHAEGPQPDDLSAEGPQPRDLRAEGSQPEDLSKEGSQPRLSPSMAREAMAGVVSWESSKESDTSFVGLLRTEEMNRLCQERALRGYELQNPSGEDIGYVARPLSTLQQKADRANGLSKMPTDPTHNVCESLLDPVSCGSLTGIRSTSPIRHTKLFIRHTSDGLQGSRPQPAIRSSAPSFHPDQGSLFPLCSTSASHSVPLARAAAGSKREALRAHDRPWSLAVPYPSSPSALNPPLAPLPTQSPKGSQTLYLYSREGPEELGQGGWCSYILGLPRRGTGDVNCEAAGAERSLPSHIPLLPYTPLVYHAISSVFSLSKSNSVVSQFSRVGRSSSSISARLPQGHSTWSVVTSATNPTAGCASVVITDRLIHNWLLPLFSSVRHPVVRAEKGPGSKHVLDRSSSVPIIPHISDPSHTSHMCISPLAQPKLTRGSTEIRPLLHALYRGSIEIPLRSLRGGGAADPALAGGGQHIGPPASPPAFCVADDPASGTPNDPARLADEPASRTLNDVQGGEHVGRVDRLAERVVLQGPEDLKETLPGRMQPKAAVIVSWRLCLGHYNTDQNTMPRRGFARRLCLGACNRNLSGLLAGGFA